MQLVREENLVSSKSLVSDIQQVIFNKHTNSLCPA